MEPDYSNYTKLELKQALESIDQSSFPDRVAKIKKALADHPDDISAPKTSTILDFHNSLRNRLILFGLAIAIISILLVATKYLGLPVFISNGIFLFMWLASTIYFVILIISKLKNM